MRTVFAPSLARLCTGTTRNRMTSMRPKDGRLVVFPVRGLARPSRPPTAMLEAHAISWQSRNMRKCFLFAGFRRARRRPPGERWVARRRRAGDALPGGGSRCLKSSSIHSYLTIHFRPNTARIVSPHPSRSERSLRKTTGDRNDKDASCFDRSFGRWFACADNASFRADRPRR
jgi:hypothetical protein